MKISEIKELSEAELQKKHRELGDELLQLQIRKQTGQVEKSPSAYERPQPHACFIQRIDDDLVNEGGIMDLWVREARLFKYGSGTGTNIGFFFFGLPAILAATSVVAINELFANELSEHL